MADSLMELIGARERVLRERLAQARARAAKIVAAAEERQRAAERESVPDSEREAQVHQRLAGAREKAAATEAAAVKKAAAFIARAQPHRAGAVARALDFLLADLTNLPGSGADD